MAHIAVIGAGIVGMCCAAWLQRDGNAVTVIDPRAPGEGCSFGNAGLLSPGAIVPPVLPGAWRNIPRWLVDPLGPLALRWRYLPWLAPWLLHWMRAGTEQRAREVSAALKALHAPVFEGYAELLDGADSDLIRRTGQLYVSEQPDGALGPELVQRLRAEAGVRCEVLRDEALREIEPALGAQFRSGLYFPEHGHSVNSLRLVKVLADRFRAQGGVFVRDTVRGFEIAPDGPRRVHAGARVLSFEKIVIAAGAWSHRLTAQLGTHVPLEAERGYHLTLPAPGVMPRVPLVNRDAGFTITPMENGLRLAGTAEFAGVDAPPDYRRARMLLTHAQRTLPGLSGVRATEWMGCRPSLPDGPPVIDHSPRFSNVWFAFGHAHFGLTEAPTTGRLIADLVAGRAPALDLAPYRVSRFS
jgi:D-amino-acid dehydrogenase